MILLNIGCSASFTVNIIIDKTRNRSKGYGYVTFAEEDDAEKALISTNGKVIDGRAVYVDKVRKPWPTPTAREPSQPPETTPSPRYGMYSVIH
ncbi:small RNA-binding protein 11, chloroplastic-like [Cannabis sativa]|uniref:small RNA-binding protein 11, chloroplastic-like n=1 Tax=Cannabis sativa TaxID=3483 RepID=UPI0029C9F6DA|nr:small RNA-binding protein 11, chloroplastic-like [Cannabis sativa]